MAPVAENAALRGEISHLRETLERLEKWLEKLQARVRKDRWNSNKPPSWDRPSATPHPPAKPTGRERGGQPGRKGCTRRVLPEGSEDRVVPASTRGRARWH